MAFQFGMDFQGLNAEPEIITISSDEEMDTNQWSSDEEYEEDEDIVQMAFCVEKALENAGTTGGQVMSVSIPCQPKPENTWQQHALPDNSAAMTSTGRFPTQYFDLGRGCGPIERDSRQRNGHPIQFCSELIP